MRKVFKNCRAMDKRCYDEYGLTEDILMEHAAGGMANYINTHLPDKESILIVCGSGNNGADGLVLARLMKFNVFSVKIYLPFGAKSPMAKLQLARVKKLKYIEIVDEICEADIIVDSLFGAGLNRALGEKNQDIVDAMNDLNGYKIACDIPTGIDENGKAFSSVFDADTTITMGARKESLYTDEFKDSVGIIHRIDLGIRYNHYTRGVPVDSYLLDMDDLELPTRDFSQSTHKGDFGHAVIFAGDMSGAGIMSAMAASRFGAGLTTVVSLDKYSIPIYLMNKETPPATSSAMAIGMGLGSALDEAYVEKHIVDSRLPIVLDADSFYRDDILAILKQKEREIVLTPHPKEFATLWKHLTNEDISVSDIQSDRFAIVRRFSALYPHVTLLLKGANMLIVNEGEMYINPLGSTKLSKGGSGDVLSGLVVALLAQGYSAIDAAIQGSLAFAKASNAYKGASYSMLATDIIEQISLLEGE